MNRFTDPKAPARELVSFGKRHERCIMSDKTPPDEDPTRKEGGIDRGLDRSVGCGRTSRMGNLGVHFASVSAPDQQARWKPDKHLHGLRQSARRTAH
jgi:hypothetical protein